MVSEDLEQSLRAEVDDYINGRLNGLQEEIARLQSQVNEAFTRLSERMKSETEMDASVAVAISEHLRASFVQGTEEAAAQSARAKASSDMALIKAAVDEIDNQRSQADILNALVNRAASFAPRVAFFVIKNERATGWRARGLEGTVGDDAVREISLPLSDNTVLSEVVRSRSTWSGAPGSNSNDHQLLEKLGGEPPERMVAVPLNVRDRAVGVLYADSAALGSEAINLEAIESLVRVTGMAVELLAATKRPAPTQAKPVEHRAAPLQEAQPATPQEQPQAAAPQDQPQPQPEWQPQPEPEGQPEGQPQVTPPAPEAVSAPPPTTYEEPAPQETPAPAPRTETVEAEATAAPQEERGIVPVAPATSTGNLGGFNISTSPTSQATSSSPASFAAPLGETRRYGAADTELPVQVNEEEKRFHNDARRFARLLVSEIKLYNEQKVREGRAAGDLYNRLREEIDRSRQMYDKRIAPHVASRYDYFHHELINTLAEGDQAKLGEGYPGAAV